MPTNSLEVASVTSYLWELNVVMRSYNAYCSLSDAIGMFVTRCSVFKSVSVSGAKRSKFFRAVVGLWVMPDEAINSRGIVVPLGG